MNKELWELGDQIKSLVKDRGQGFYRMAYGFKDKTNFVMLAATEEDPEKLEQLKQLAAEWYGDKDA